MDNLEKRPEDSKVSESLLELCIDQDHVTITVERFEELVKAEATLEVVRGAHKLLDHYDLKKVLSAVLYPGKVESNDE